MSGEIVRPGEGSPTDLSRRELGLYTPREPERYRTDYPPDYVYVIEFTTGVVKVGFSNTPEKRIGQHRTESQRFGTDIARSWVSKPHADGRRNETSLILWCTSKGSLHGGAEYFRGVDFDQLVLFAKGLPYAAPRPSEHSDTKPLTRFDRGAPRPVYAHGMELAIQVSIQLWESLLKELGDRPITPKQLRSLVDGAHVSLVQSMHDPAAWAEGAS